MAELKWTEWIKVSVCLLLGLHFIAAAVQSPSLTVTQGYVTVLPCYTNRDVFDNCDGTTWTFQQPGGRSVNLVERGKNKYCNKGPNRKSISLSMRCSLVLLGVRARDAGVYTCKQFVESRQEQIQAQPVYLSVVTVNEKKDKDMTSLSCSVVPLEWCHHRVHWLYDYRKGGNVDMEDVYQSCKTMVSFNTSHLQHKSKYEELFSCHVTSANSRELQINFAPQTLEEGTGVPNGYATTPQQGPRNSKEQNRDAFRSRIQSGKDELMLLSAPVHHQADHSQHAQAQDGEEKGEEELDSAHPFILDFH
ncbi:hypothetical protein INR49_003468, partial [Caranx melampygus]